MDEGAPGKPGPAAVTGPAAPPELPPPSEPPPPPGVTRLRFDGASAGPKLPPAPPGHAAGTSVAPVAPVAPAAPAVTDAVLAIPLGTRRLVATSLDLLTRSDTGLRAASFYIGLVMLLAVGPLAVLLGLAWVTLGEEALFAMEDPTPWAGWLGLAAVPAALGYVAASMDAVILATAVIGGRAEGRPLRLASSIAVVRRRFWRVLGAQLAIGILVSTVSFMANALVMAAVGPVPALDYGIELVVGLVVGAPFVYVTAGIVLGEVGAFEAIARSVRLVAARKMLAVVVTLFGLLSQLLVVLGLGIGLDILFRVGVGTGLEGDIPPVVVIPVVAALVFAVGTLTFLVEAIAAAPAVYAFAALTHYTRGLELGRREPLPARRPWEPYLTRWLAVGAGLGLLALVGGILGLPA